MRRRDWIKGAGALAGAAAVDVEAGRRVDAEARGFRAETVRIRLRHTWTTTMSSSEFRDVVYAHYEAEGERGIGEGAPIVRYGEDAASARGALEGARDVILAGDPWCRERMLEDAFTRLRGQYAARAALDIAVHDWTGRRLGIPVYRLLGLDPEDAPLTTFSIGIDTPEVTRQKVREAAEYPVLKVKVGLDTDEATIDAVRSATGKPLRVDANEGWTDRDEAARKIEWLVGRGVELVEQPMPAAMMEETRWLRDRFDVPIFADEACTHPSDIPRLSAAYDGVNIKLDKAGGMAEAVRMIHAARACGLKVMLGCMVSTSVSTTAAAHLSPLVDFADLDGNLLIANDPWAGVRVREGRLILPTGPGLGLVPRPA